MTKTATAITTTPGRIAKAASDKDLRPTLITYTANKTPAANVVSGHLKFNKKDRIRSPAAAPRVSAIRRLGWAPSEAGQKRSRTPHQKSASASGSARASAMPRSHVVREPRMSAVVTTGASALRVATYAN